MTELIIYGVFLVALGTFALTFGIPFFRGAPYAPTDKQAIEIMLRLAKCTPGERAIDIGSGDGRLVIALARTGARADGCEVNPILVWWSRKNIKKAGLASSASIIKESLWDIDYSKYAVVTVFGIKYIMERLSKKLLAELPAGARVISNKFTLPGWTPVAEEKNIYLYVKR